MVNRMIEAEGDVDEKACGRHYLIEVRFVILTSLARLLPLVAFHPPAMGACCPRRRRFFGLRGWLPLEQARAFSSRHSVYPFTILFYPDYGPDKDSNTKLFNIAVSGIRAIVNVPTFEWKGRITPLARFRRRRTPAL